MKNKYAFVAVMLAAILLVGMGLTNIYVNSQKGDEKEEELVIVTSFYPMYIAADNVVGDVSGVKLVNLSEPQTGCLHDFQLTPEDMKLLGTADIFLINGGGIESFMEEVAKSYPNLKIVEASKNNELLSDGDEENAHVWMSIPAYETQIETIAEELGRLDSDRSDYYKENAARYLEKLAPLRERQQKIEEAAAGQSVVLFHEAYDYVAEDYGLKVSHVLDLDEERQVSAGEVSDVLAAIERDQVKYIFAEETYGKSMGDTMEKESDVKVVYLNPLNRGEYEKDSYIEGMSKNLDLLEQCFLSGE